jgi:hypothetical protein
MTPFFLLTGEAIGKMLVGKRISNKINYDKLKDLDFSFAPSSSLSDSAPSTSTVTEPVEEKKPPVSSSTRSRYVEIKIYF